ncbi:MAG: diacylglycerol kinase family lipid kinase [Clostridiales Family XIII bacterium]|jgi:YegS/Rv2252/BmrU family lipid kinase|nr:diacylglycerol kinase family lipid kinase [Clostridiales Family XIII bacterium]
MKHYFVINPVAGKGEAKKIVLPEILKVIKSIDIDYEIHRTTGPTEAEAYTKKRCEESNGRPIRFYACGGDGTLNEVLNGLYNYPGAELTVIPSGSGNDFVRNFPDYDFRNIRKLISGEARSLDLIEYSDIGETDTDTPNPPRYAINMCNIGFDSEAVAIAGRLKTKSFIGGTAAYIGGVCLVLIQKKTVKLTFLFEDGSKYTERTLLTAIANGAYCGGGFKGAPMADTNDGLLDVSIVNELSRRLFLTLLRKYHRGSHLQDPRAKDLMQYKQVKSVTITPKDKMTMAVDGEVGMYGKLSFKIIPNAVMFSFPCL